MVKPQSSERVSFLSYPKTGNTWSRLMIGSYFQLSTGEKFEFLLEDEPEEHRLLGKHGLPVFDSSHRPLEWETQSADDLSHDNVVRPFLDGKVILMVRYPLDAVFSAFMQHHHGRDHEKRRKFSSFAAFADDRVFGIEKAVKFYNVWSEVLDRSNIFSLKYEVLRRDPLATTGALLRFLNVAIREPILREAIQLRSFENMRKMEISGNVPTYRASGYKIFATGNLNNPNAYFVREGRFRAYRQHVSPADCQRLEQLVQTRLSPKFGYQTDEPGNSPIA